MDIFNLALLLLDGEFDFIIYLLVFVYSLVNYRALS